VRSQELLERFQFKKVPHLIILTKSDKLSRQALIKNEAMIRDRLALDHSHQIIPFSALKKTGRDEVWKAILEKIRMRDKWKSEI